MPCRYACHEELEFLQIPVLMLKAGSDRKTHLQVNGIYPAGSILFRTKEKREQAHYCYKEYSKINPNEILELHKSIEETY
jgi:hypothetical protein